jgi:hypothetical protein
MDQSSKCTRHGLSPVSNLDYTPSWADEKYGSQGNAVIHPYMVVAANNL